MEKDNVYVLFEEIKNKIENKTIGFVDAASLGFCQGYVFV